MRHISEYHGGFFRESFEKRMNSTNDNDIAIVGMACMFSKAPDVETYWERILAGACAIGDHPDPEILRYFDPNSEAFERIYTKRGAFLGDLAKFNPMEFGVMPDSLDGVEPDHFLALKVAKAALDDAGWQKQKNFPRERTDIIIGHGVYVNPSNVNWIQHGLVLDQTVALLAQINPHWTAAELKDIHQKLKAQLPPLNAAIIPSMIPNIIAGRIANRLDLMGANYIIDAACASSIVAITHGVNNLLLNRCDAALVGGVQACMLAQDLMTFCQIGALSHRNDSPRPFDADADGTLFGEGVGMAVLKRRKDAERDGDRIYAFIKGFGLSSDGKSSGLLAPRFEGEVLAIRRAYETSGIDPRIHRSGRGPRDRDSTGRRHRGEGADGNLRRPRQDRSALCAIGSVKSMIGHCVPAAGISSVIKATMALHQKVIPPTGNFTKPHPTLGIDQTPFYISTETRPWVHGGKHAAPRRCQRDGLRRHQLAPDPRGGGGMKHAALSARANFF
jgi:acyl transferase domain-containing protein